MAVNKFRCVLYSHIPYEQMHPKDESVHTSREKHKIQTELIKKQPEASLSLSQCVAALGNLQQPLTWLMQTP